jgi:thioredoxin reductase (NADPH)
MYDLVIVGGGPAGASAAVFTGRAGLRTLVIDADKGITRKAWVNNHLGFPDGIAGPDLVHLGRLHAEKAGAEWAESTVTSLSRGEDGTFVLGTDDGGEHRATEVLLATGIQPGLAEAAGIETTEGTEPRIATVAVVDSDGRATLDGVWAAGTAAGVSVHTIVTAGDGARVALNLLSRRKGERHVDHDVLRAPSEG